uniref:Uncharacterized protein n=1 Tax=Paramormyrops kingsleyae TaxID=1676925 RepID=A0A3B3SV90_9TELE
MKSLPRNWVLSHSCVPPSSRSMQLQALWCEQPTAPFLLRCSACQACRQMTFLVSKAEGHLTSDIWGIHQSLVSPTWTRMSKECFKHLVKLSGSILFSHPHCAHLSGCHPKFSLYFVCWSGDISANVQAGKRPQTWRCNDTGWIPERDQVMATHCSFNPFLEDITNSVLTS